jgi:hypothetical protein
VSITTDSFPAPACIENVAAHGEGGFSNVGIMMQDSFGLSPLFSIALTCIEAKGCWRYVRMNFRQTTKGLLSAMALIVCSEFQAQLAGDELNNGCGYPGWAREVAQTLKAL